MTANAHLLERLIRSWPGEVGSGAEDGCAELAAFLVKHSALLVARETVSDDSLRLLVGRAHPVRMRAGLRHLARWGYV
jgi:hypothetical protein